MKAKYVKASYLLLLWLLGAAPVAAQSFTGRTVLGEKYARQQVLSIVKKAPEKAFAKPLLPTKEVAVAVAEPVLFNIFGKQQIVQERPYEAYLINGYWYISGTLPKEYEGGTFEIIMEANNGRVVHLIHDK
ncbi:MAG: NTF2 fold immunity protein [Janthinobacterium lividum]